MMKVRQYIESCHMIDEGDRIITGVSGGADSVCLLFMLFGLQKELGFTLVVCHVNHCLRGRESDGDQEYVEKLCRDMGIRCHVFREDVVSNAKKWKQSLEEAGRLVRRRTFEETCRLEGGTKIATAHNSDDNAETVLLNISRGTGLKGLCGIHPSKDRWIRPLLCLSGEEIRSWMEENDVPYRTDKSNHEDEYTRNRIRHNVIPMLENEVNQGAAEHLNSLSRQAREIWAYMERQAQEAYVRCVTEREDGIFIGRAEAEREDIAVRRLLLRKCIAQAAGREKDIGSVHVEALESLFSMQAGRRRNLPYGVTASREYGGVLLKMEKAGDKVGDIAGEKDRDRGGDGGNGQVVEGERGSEEWILPIPGQLFLEKEGKRIVCSVESAENENYAKTIPQKSYTKCFDYDIIGNSLSVRYRRPGDYIVIDGEGRRQKLKSYFINEKVPSGEREKLLLVADGQHIIWIPGMRMSAQYRVSGNTRRILKISITEE